MKTIVFTDATHKHIGFIAEFEGDGCLLLKHPIKDMTTNVAEYNAVLGALRVLSMYDDDAADVDVEVYCDSEVVVNQLNGRYDAKDWKLAMLRDVIKTNLLPKFKTVSFCHIDGKLNPADELVRKGEDFIEIHI